MSEFTTGRTDRNRIKFNKLMTQLEEVSREIAWLGTVVPVSEHDEKEQYLLSARRKIKNELLVLAGFKVDPRKSHGESR